MAYEERSYRRLFAQEDLVHFQVAYKETDLDIGIPKAQFKPELVRQAEEIIRHYRWQLEAYLARDPVFARTLVPHDVPEEAPPIAREMAAAASLAGVGPMAAVAGAMAQYVATDLVGPGGEIIVENGGDIYLNSSRSRLIGIFAGASPFSHRLALKVEPRMCPLGICTSSGTVGPSLSFGRADAAVILATSAALADAVATAAGNTVQEPADVEKAARLAANIPGVLGAVIIAGDKLAAWGQVDLVRIEGRV
ncbi:hypothetical protein MGLY_29560 [Neomoorella glycerini]|uniref:Uncharacterized protein n=1 Tax=Neomoorella glycerini TaxID=55779 RepID=A0A6I5ZUC1_9FIRM|nr:UPF0280 family protein [Moorella glycerini]QGP93540.1 hypothetical protein MGLY_29560 [Moorella glycerini]